MSTITENGDLRQFIRITSMSLLKRFNPRGYMSILTVCYKKILKPILFKFDPDLIHSLFTDIGICSYKYPTLNKIVRKMYGPPSGKKTIMIDGLKFQGPVILSAGFDYNGYLSPILYDMGFAGEEVGSVSARPSKGNPPPHLKRLVRSKSIQVYKGLKNDGVDAIIERIKGLNIPKDFVLGISIARTNDALCSDESEGIKDYLYSFKRLNEENIGSFYTLNISCPNAFTGENFSTPESLERLLRSIKEQKSSKPIYIKMPINKSWDQFNDLLKVIDKYKIQGVVIGNLNKDYNDLDFPDEVEGIQRGGLSGKPCFELSNKLIKKTRANYPNMTIFGCGGVMSAEDAMTKLEAGANIIQLISGMIFSGPQLMNEINKKHEEQA